MATHDVTDHVSPSLLTDRYELTMLDSFVSDGSVEHAAVFEAFARRLPEGRRYGVLGGLGRLLPLVERFRFDADEVAWLRAEGVVCPPEEKRERENMVAQTEELKVEVTVDEPIPAADAPAPTPAEGKGEKKKSRKGGDAAPAAVATRKRTFECVLAAEHLTDHPTNVAVVSTWHSLRLKRGNALARCGWYRQIRPVRACQVLLLQTP